LDTFRPFRGRRDPEPGAANNKFVLELFGLSVSLRCRLIDARGAEPDGSALVDSAGESSYSSPGT